ESDAPRRFGFGGCVSNEVGVNQESARGFIEWAQQEKHPQAWQIEQWTEAIRWSVTALGAERTPRAAQPCPQICLPNSLQLTGMPIFGMLVHVRKGERNCYPF